MSETHELRLKIDAAGAESGAKRFKGAIASVRKAVNDLDRDTTGAFTSLKSISPKVDVAGLKAATAEANRLSKATAATGNASDRAAERIRKLALQSANALRVSTDQASRLRDRLLSVGDTAGLAKLEAGLNRLRTSLTNATSGLDVREARAGYADLASELNRTARESERLRAETISAAQAQEAAANAARQHSTQLEQLRARYDSTYRISKQYEAQLADINMLENAGALSAVKAAQAREQASASLMAAGNAATVYAGKARVSGMHTANMAAQFNDIGVMLAAGQSPLLLAVQQGTQVSQVLNMMGNRASILATLKSGFLSMINPISLATIGIIAAGAALVQWAMSAGSAESAGAQFEKQLERLQDLSSGMESTISILEMDLAALAEKYGVAAESVRELAIAQAELRIGKIQEELRAQVGELDFITLRYKQARGAMELYSKGVRNIAFDFGISREKAEAFEGVLMRLGRAKTFEDQRDALKAVVEHAEKAGIELEKFPPELRDAAIQMIELSNESDAMRQLLERASDSIANATGQTAAWAGAMSGVRMEINAILSSLSSIGGGVLSNAAKGAELTALRAGRSIRESTTARIRYQKEAEFSAREQGAGWFERQLIGAERFQFEESLRLDSQLDKARAAAREAAKSSSGKGGGGRKGALTTEQKAVEDLNKSLKDRLTSLQEEKIELDLVASGQFETAEGARAMAEAMVAGGGAVDAQTAAMIRQIDAAAKLNQELKKVSEDPVKKWRESVPTWKEAATEIEMGAINHVRDALSDMIKTGKFDIEALGEAILGTVADIVADKAMKELHTLLGGADREGGGLLGGLFGGFNSIGDEAPAIGEGAGVAQGGVQAGQSISTAMIQAGQQVSQQLTAAMTQGGQQAGQQTRTAHAQGGQQAANATRMAGMQHGQQVRSATMTSGQQHATKVKTAIETGGQQHASMVRSASAGGGGGGGGGLLSGLFGGDGIGGILSMAVGAFAEGGMSNSPVGMATAPISAFRHAPHFAQGTPNTSGIPSILHPNEAVVNLTKGRKIPVELNGDPAAGAGGQTVNYAPTYHINTPDADSFRKTQSQVAADGLSAAQRALQRNR
ncbi:phage tail length tape measure family protein [uncultured Roseovarius sp.]|uniref:phage tail length tape measure family protein n=1 Tax=uncultured Roseovarius sp. TaxID=293344 RepID=UPI0025977E88|nr:phage tail length tape measure family protein [uncultured Roseovarius sp.]